MNYSREELESIVAYVRRFNPEILQEDKLEVYMNKIEAELVEAGIGGDNIPKLLKCREILQAHTQHLSYLVGSYYEAKQLNESKYKERRAEITLKGSSATSGKVDAEKVDSEIKADFIASERIYKQLHSAVNSLETRDNILSQRISYLKQQFNLTQHVNH